MKKILSILFLILFISCEDKSENVTPSGLKGTYKLKKDYQFCDGKEDVWYITIEDLSGDKIKMNEWDYMGDECDNEGDCYVNGNVMLTKDGDKYSFTESGLTTTIEKNGNGVKITLRLAIHGAEYFLYDRESNDVKEYSPICN